MFSVSNEGSADIIRMALQGNQNLDAESTTAIISVTTPTGGVIDEYEWKKTFNTRQRYNNPLQSHPMYYHPSHMSPMDHNHNNFSQGEMWFANLLSSH